MAHYSATKTMQLSLSRSLAELTKGTSVTVNTILPGSTKTEGVSKLVESIFPGVTPMKPNVVSCAKIVPPPCWNGLSILKKSLTLLLLSAAHAPRRSTALRSA